jgi:hypothetical protein
VNSGTWTTFTLDSTSTGTAATTVVASQGTSVKIRIFSLAIANESSELKRVRFRWATTPFIQLSLGALGVPFNWNFVDRYPYSANNQALTFASMAGGTITGCVHWERA